MTTSYFKTSNIEKLTNRSRNKNKNKKVSDKDAEYDKDDKDAEYDKDDKDEKDEKYEKDEKDEKDEKIVEGFGPTSTSGGKSPSSNIFGSSDTDSNKKDDTTNPTSVKGTQKSAQDQVDPNSILIFCIHALLSVLFAYIWGWLSTNFIYLATESKDKLDYILPIDEYQKPYTNNPDPDKTCYFNYGFPYHLGDRVISPKSVVSNSIIDIRKRQKDITYFLWLSKDGNKDGKSEVGFYKALVQYIFEAVFGGLGMTGGRGLMRWILSIFSITNSTSQDKEDTWEKMKSKTFNKAAAFFLWPTIIMQIIFPAVGLWSGITSFIFGILQNHIIWGLIFGLTIGMFIAMGCGFYMILNVFYVFFIYPWSNSNDNSEDSSKGKWKKIFDDLKIYMLLIFYYQICMYGFSDLGEVGGAGIMLIVIVSLVMQWMKHSS